MWRSGSDVAIAPPDGHRGGIGADRPLAAGGGPQVGGLGGLVESSRTAWGQRCRGWGRSWRRQWHLAPCPWQYPGGVEFLSADRAGGAEFAGAGELWPFSTDPPAGSAHLSGGLVSRALPVASGGGHDPGGGVDLAGWRDRRYRRPLLPAGAGRGAGSPSGPGHCGAGAGGSDLRADHAAGAAARPLPPGPVCLLRV